MFGLFNKDKPQSLKGLKLKNVETLSKKQREKKRMKKNQKERVLFSYEKYYKKYMEKHNPVEALKETKYKIKYPEEYKKQKLRKIYEEETERIIEEKQKNNENSDEEEDELTTTTTTGGNTKTPKTGIMQTKQIAEIAARIKEEEREDITTQEAVKRAIEETTKMEEAEQGKMKKKGKQPVRRTVSPFLDKRKRAIRRLVKEFQEIVVLHKRQTHPEGIGLLPTEDCFFTWRATMKAPNTKDCIYQFNVKIPANYPEGCVQLKLINQADANIGYHNNIMTQFNTQLIHSHSYGKTILKQLETYYIQLSHLFIKYNHTQETRVKAEEHWPRVFVKSLYASFFGTTSLGFEETMKDKLICTFTRENLDETTLGIGISFEKNLSTGEIAKVTSSYELLSQKAFTRYGIRCNSNYNIYTECHRLYTSTENQLKVIEQIEKELKPLRKEEFTHWIPLYLSKGHGKNILPLAKRQLSIICSARSDSFELEHVEKVLSLLLHDCVLRILNKNFDAATGLRNYQYIHRLYLMFIQEYPELKKMINKKLMAFLENPEIRLKTNTPNLGLLLVYLTVSDIGWEDVRDVYIEESWARAVYWMFKSNPKLDPEYHYNKKTDTDIDYTDEEYIKLTYQATSIGSKLMALQIFLLKNCAHPTDYTFEDVAENYDRYYNQPSLELFKAFNTNLTYIQEMDSHYKALKAAGIEVDDDEEIMRMLRKSIQVSRRVGYHRREYQITTSEEYAIQNRFPIDQYIVNKEVLEGPGGERDSEKAVQLIDDDNVWKNQVIKRYYHQIAEEKPAHLDYREYFLSLYLAELIEILPETKDFGYFYSIINMANSYVTQLNIPLNVIHGLKSSYYFLSQVIARLENLTSLTFTLVNCTAVTEVMFKEICKGLKSANQLQSLNLSNIGINHHLLKLLIDAEIAGEKIEVLDLSYNPLGGQGLHRLALFLTSHTRLSNLKTLMLRACNLSNIEELGDALVTKKKLEDINISKNPNLNIDEFLRFMSFLPNIRVVNVSQINSRVSNGLASLVEFSNSIEDLNLYKISQIDGTSLEKGIQHNVSLKKLDLGHIARKISFEQLIRGLTKNTTLKEFNVEHMNLTHNDLKVCIVPIDKDGNKSVKHNHLAFGVIQKDGTESANHGITTMSLASNSFRANEAKHCFIGQWLSYFGELKHINLSKCHMGKHELDSLATYVLPQNKVETLNVSLNNFSEKNALTKFCEALAVCTSLKHLKMDSSKLYGSGAHTLAQALEQNASLESLSLFGNFMDISGCTSILKALTANKKNKLCSLDLGVNRIRRRGAVELTTYLKTPHCQLHSIAIKDNHIPDRQAMALLDALRDTGRGKALSLAGNPLSDTTRGEISRICIRESIHFDLTSLVLAKSKRVNTIYIPNLPMRVNKHMLKQFFAREQDCGKVISVCIKFFKKRDGNFSCYAFVEFADETSVLKAMTKSNRVSLAGTKLKIYRAGIEQS
mmetsp:Transcript_4074/g.6026  ORF Transcript_4074/g.6026 Transcript_4074/m.6026 type:complete len:1464 (+) Transcript_4074:42-4433(+)